MSGRVGPLKPTFLNSYSLNFDGVDDYLKISPPNLGTVFTISHWFKDIGFPPLASCSIGRDNGQTLFLSSGGSQFQITNEAVSNGIFITAQVLKDACVDGNWHNIICVRRPATNGDTNYSDVEVFLDGSSIDGAINLLTNNAPLDNVIYIGRDKNQFYPYNGFIDEMAFWNNDQTVNVSTISTSPVEDLSPLTPVSWWRMGDNGTWKSPQWLIPNNENKTKFSNYSFEYDGVDDYVPVSGSIISSAGDMTISSWANFSSLAGVQGIFDSTNYYRSGFNGGFSFRTIGTNLDVVFSNGTVFSTHNATSGLSTSGGWYHLAFTFNNTTKLGTFYVNGSSIDTYTFTGFDNADLVNGGVIGRAVRTNSYCFTGFLDEISVFDSIVDIATIYNSGVPNDLSSLSPVGYWRSENSTFSTNWTVTDNGSGSNDGTSANMTIEDRVGDASNSTLNAVSFNMDEEDRETDVPT